MNARDRSGPLGELIARLPPDAVLTDPDVLAGYRFCWAADPCAGVPLAVVRARGADEVQTTMRWAHECRVPVVPRGAGTSLSGGSSGLDDGIVLSTERMRGVRIDPDTRVAIVEPGAFNAEVKAAARGHGLWYPPDPSSYEMCSIGGNIATNAGGLCCVKYGVTADYVLGLDVVLADGTLVHLGGALLKDVAGLPLLKLFVGSEGTLGVITKAVLRLIPAQHPPSTLAATFATVADAATAVVAITRQVRPALLELMDAACVNVAEDHVRMGLDRTAGALLLAQSDAGGAAGEEEIAQMSRLCGQLGATDVFSTSDPDEGQAFLMARRSVIPAAERLGALLFEDVGVSVPRLPELLAGVSRIAEANAVQILTVAHAGDGNTHPLIVHDPGDPDSLRRARLAFDEIMALAISLDGTITGEHGVGRLKKAYLPAQVGPEVMALTRRIKDALDPLGILNPGVLI